MEGGVGALSAFSSALTATIRVSQTIYELKAVDEQARDLLDTTTHVDSTLSSVRTLRRQKSTHLSPTEKKWIDEILFNTDKTLKNVCSLIEPARVDMKTKFGKVGFRNKVAFILRDSPRVETNLARLGIASQSLNTAMGVLCGREGARQVFGSPVLGAGGWDGGGDRGPAGSIENISPPPAYEEIMRRRDEKRRSSARSSTTPGDDVPSSDLPPVSKAYEPISNLAVGIDQPPSIITSTDTIYPKLALDLNFKPNNHLFIVETAEVMPPPSLEPITRQPSTLSVNMDGADGLQVVMPDIPEVNQDWHSIRLNTSPRYSFSTLSSQSEPQSPPEPLGPTHSPRTSSHRTYDLPAQLTPGAASHIDVSPQPYNPPYPCPDSPIGTTQSPPQQTLRPSPRPTLDLYKSLPPKPNSNSHSISNEQLPLCYAPSASFPQAPDSVVSTRSLQPYAHAHAPIRPGSAGPGGPGNGNQKGYAAYSARRGTRGKDRRENWLEWQASR